MAKGEKRRQIMLKAGSEPTVKAESWQDMRKRMELKLAKLSKGGHPQRHRECRDPPVKEEHVVDLDLLDNPPEEFVNKYSWLDNPKYPNATEGFMLLQFHFWGFNHHYPKNHLSRALAFIKLFYNMDPTHRIENKEEFEDINRDAGPRLLKKEILQRLQIAPISRHYPDVPQSKEDWETQRLSPPKPPLEEERRAQMRTRQIESVAPEHTPENLDFIRESLEKLLIQMRYKDLEIPQLAKSRQPQTTFLTLASGTDHIFTLSDQGISYPCLDLGPAAMEGDSGANLACDCIIMAGKLLDAGITAVDSREIASDQVQVTSMHELLVNAVMMKWGTPDSAQQREIFHRNVLEHTLHDLHDLIEWSTLLRAQFTLTRETANYCEDGHRRVVHTASYRCLRLLETSDVDDIGCLLQRFFDTVPSKPSSPTETRGNYRPDLFEPDSRPKCTVEGCQKPISSSRICHIMPLRLAIYPSQGMVLGNHTSDDVRFNVTNRNGEKETVIYRWLGGIYSDSNDINGQDTRYRVYWTDNIRGERKTNNIRMYDPSLHGYFIGDIKPARDGSVIPRRWQPSIVFYEAVLNPDPLDLALATAVLGDMGYATQTGQFILQVHPHWSTDVRNDNHAKAKESQLSSSEQDDTGLFTSATKENREFNIIADCSDFPAFIDALFPVSGAQGHDGDTSIDCPGIIPNEELSGFNTAGKQNHSSIADGISAQIAAYPYPASQTVGRREPDITQSFGQAALYGNQSLPGTSRVSQTRTAFPVPPSSYNMNGAQPDHHPALLGRMDTRWHTGTQQRQHVSDPAAKLAGLPQYIQPNSFGYGEPQPSAGSSFGSGGRQQKNSVPETFGGSSGANDSNRRGTNILPRMPRQVTGYPNSTSQKPAEPAPRKRVAEDRGDGRRSKRTRRQP